VTTYTLQKPYSPALFTAAAKELDGVAAKLAAKAGTALKTKETVDVAGERVRAYSFGAMRIGFVLVGKREYQLLCENAGDACTRLFDSFTLS
jgi:hypothetical protein